MPLGNLTIRKLLNKKAPTQNKSQQSLKVLHNPGKAQRCRLVFTGHVGKISLKQQPFAAATTATTWAVLYAEFYCPQVKMYTKT